MIQFPAIQLYKIIVVALIFSACLINLRIVLEQILSLRRKKQNINNIIKLMNWWKQFWHFPY